MNQATEERKQKTQTFWMKRNASFDAEVIAKEKKLALKLKGLWKIKNCEPKTPVNLKFSKILQNKSQRVFQSWSKEQQNCHKKLQKKAKARNLKTKTDSLGSVKRSDHKCQSERTEKKANYFHRFT